MIPFFWNQNRNRNRNHIQKNQMQGIGSKEESIPGLESDPNVESAPLMKQVQPILCVLFFLTYFELCINISIDASKWLVFFENLLKNQSLTASFAIDRTIVETDSSLGIESTLLFELEKESES